MSKDVKIAEKIDDIHSLLRLFQKEWSRGDHGDMRLTMQAIHTLSDDICWIIDEVEE